MELFMFDQQVLYALIGVLILIFLKTLLGVLAAIKAGTFEAKRFPDFLRKEVMPFVGSLILLAAASMFNPDLKVFFFGSLVPITYYLLTGVKDKFKELAGGIDITSGGTG